MKKKKSDLKSYKNALNCSHQNGTENIAKKREKERASLEKREMKLIAIIGFIHVGIIETISVTCIASCTT